MESAIQTQNNVKMVPAIRVQGKWYAITPKPYEPERQTYGIAHKLIQGSTPEVAYRQWFEQERKDAKLLYPSFGKDVWRSDNYSYNLYSNRDIIQVLYGLLPGQ